MFFKSKAFVMLAAVLALGGCKKESGAGDAAQVPTVAAVKVEPQNIPLSFEFAARAQGSKETEVRARVGGILLKRNYVEGSQVEEGSVLFQIDPEPFKVTLNQAKAKLAQVNAELKNALGFCQGHFWKISALLAEVGKAQMLRGLVFLLFAQADHD